MAKHRFSKTSTSEAHELHDMVTTMSQSLREAEDLWDEVAETTDPKHASLSHTWSNVVYIKGVVSDTMAAIEFSTLWDLVKVTLGVYKDKENEYE